MTLRRTLAVAAALALLFPAAAGAAEPRPGASLSGLIQFPRPQQMTIKTDATNGSRLTLTMGFHGRCQGGGLGEVWAGNVRATPKVRARNGRFSARLSGSLRTLGQGRTGVFRWRVTGRFVAPEVVVATVTGSAEVRAGRRTISRCRIARPTAVRLTAG